MIIISAGTTGAPRLIQPTHSDYAYFSMTAATVYRYEDSVYLAVLTQFYIRFSGYIKDAFCWWLCGIGICLVVLDSNLLSHRIKYRVVIIKKPTQMSRRFY